MYMYLCSGIALLNDALERTREESGQRPAYEKLVADVALLKELRTHFMRRSIEARGVGEVIYRPTAPRRQSE